MKRIYVRASVAHLGADPFANMKCPIIDGAEQKAIGERLAGMRQLVAQEETRSTKLRPKNSGLMNDFLTGMVRIAN